MESQSNYLPLEVRCYIVSQVEQGLKHSDIIENVQRKFDRNVAQGTISKLYTKYIEEGSLADKPKSGRPAELTKEEEKKMVKAAEKNRKLSAVSIAKNPSLNPHNFSHRWISEILNRNGLVHATGMPNYVNKDHREKRLAFAIEVVERKLDWRYIVFSDESDLFPDKEGKIHYRKHKGEKLDIDYGPEYCWDPRKVKVWGAISSSGVGTLTTYEGNMEATDYVNVLEFTLLRDFPFLRGTNTRKSRYSFQHDGAGVHRGNVVKTFFTENHIETFTWPPKSPDLNPLENIWAFIKGELFKKNAQLKTREETRAEIFKIWYGKVNSMVNKLYESMPKRIEKVIELNGKAIS